MKRLLNSSKFYAVLTCILILFVFTKYSGIDFSGDTIIMSIVGLFSTYVLGVSYEDRNKYDRGKFIYKEDINIPSIQKGTRSSVHPIKEGGDKMK